MAKSTTRPRVLAEGSFGAFVLDQLHALGDVEARPMFGGAGFYLEGTFFGLLYKERLYFRVSAETVTDYTSRRMKAFEPFEGRKDKSRGYYEVPIEIIESPDDLVTWARAAQRTPPLTKKAGTPTPRSRKTPRLR